MTQTLIDQAGKVRDENAFDPALLLVSVLSKVADSVIQKS